MQALWQGDISFGLVNIPVKLYAAIKEHVLGFNVLCKKCHSSLHYERWCPKCKKEIDWNDTVKGLKLPSGKMFVIDQDELKKLKPEKTDTIDIVEFVKINQVNPIYFKSHYYIAPTQKSGKSFYLLQKALESEKKAAIGRFVMRDKEYTSLIQPYENILLLNTLNYSYEIRPIGKINTVKKTTVNQAELNLAKTLINKLTKKKFDISQFKDTFAQKLKKRIEQSKKGKKIKKEKTTSQKRTKQEPLLSALKASLIAPGHSNPTARAKK
jgi:DNA end-binding protein Ku